MTKLNTLKNDIPLPIRLFLGKALLFFIIWKIVYGVFLYNSGILDYPLTTHVAKASTFVLNNSGMSGFTTNRIEIGDGISSEIYHNDRLVLFVADVCNGLELMILYIGFIICMPSSFWRKVKYILIGIIIIDLINILRCSGLIYLREYFHAYFDFAHHYLFKAVVYGVTFIMWIKYSRKISLKNEAVQVG
ncbi:archaeosortase/exosortase family protein [Algibacter aquimarinus]|uniref:Exosortase/archaeosortase family protein n=1 Tax=Algibacter aquimarinus TaxID=1136748 RepID=A0ABP9GZB3_9FLAO